MNRASNQVESWLHEWIDASDLVQQTLLDAVSHQDQFRGTSDVPDRDKLLASHPELAEELREFFEHRDRIELMIDPLRNTLKHVLNVRCPHCHNAIELLNEVRVKPVCVRSNQSNDSGSETHDTSPFHQLQVHPVLSS